MYGQDEWNVRQDDIYQPDLSDKPKKKKTISRYAVLYIIMAVTIY